MRLLTATHYFESHRGGVELVAGRLARELAAQGDEVVWMAGDASEPPPPEPRFACVPLKVWNGVEQRLGAPFPLPGPSALGRIVRRVRGADAVLLHDALYPTNVVAFLTAKAMGKPVAVIQHIGAVPYRNPVLRLLMAAANALVARPLLANADQVVFISEITRRYFAGVRFRRPPQLVFNGVDAGVFFPAGSVEMRAAARAEFGLPASGPVAAFVGRFVEKKGLSHLEALARARPDVAFALAGWGPIDPAGWGLENVHVLGGLDPAAVGRLYRCADALVLPSAGEGFPLVVQEALASGLAVVCGDETATADPAAARHLHPVVLDAAPDVVACALSAALDAALAAPEDAQERARFATARYSWARAAREHRALIGALADPQAAALARPAP